MMETDQKLLAKARSGDGAARAALIERHQKAVVGVLFSLLHDFDSVQEAAGEAFSEAFAAKGPADKGPGFKVLVMRRTLQGARSRRRWSWLSGGGSWEASAATGGGAWEQRLRGAGGLSAETRRNLERKLELERAMSGLPWRELEVAALRLEGFSLEEIAQALGCGGPAARAAVLAATGRLRRRLL